MKTILIPVDFSDTSQSTAEYAAGFAKFSNARLILFHVYSVPVPLAGVAVSISPLEKIEEAGITQLNAFNETLIDKNPGIDTVMITRAGFVTEEILLILEEQKIDLVIMGIGSRGKEGVLGSNTADVMKHAKCPVLTIHEGVQFKKPEKIALACDYSTIVPDAVVGKFKDVVHLFNSDVLVFDMLKRSEMVTQEKADAEVSLENSLIGVSHSMHYPFGDDLPEETNNFVEKNNVDMLVMIPHNYPFLKSVFHHSATKEMAFRSKVPLLSIHE
jgi:nucleotide-binding universal stress UspA family protein